MLREMVFKKMVPTIYTNSYLYPEKQADYQFKDTYRRIEQGIEQFEYGEEVDVQTLEYLDKLLEYCSKQHIQVIAFIPPFAPSVVDRMEGEGHYKYLKKIMPSVQDMFDRYEYEIYDFTDVRKIGCDDSYFVDGFHGSDIVYSMIIKEMCGETSVLQEIVDFDKLNSMIDHRYSNMTFEKVKELGGN